MYHVRTRVYVCYSKIKQKRILTNWVKIFGRSKYCQQIIPLYFVGNLIWDNSIREKYDYYGQEKCPVCMFHFFCATLYIRIDACYSYSVTYLTFRFQPYGLFRCSAVEDLFRFWTSVLDVASTLDSWRRGRSVVLCSIYLSKFFLKFYFTGSFSPLLDLDSWGSLDYTALHNLG